MTDTIEVGVIKRPADMPDGTWRAIEMVWSIMEYLMTQAGGASTPPQSGTSPAISSSLAITRFKVSDEALAWMARKEGIILRLYNDSSGHATIGVGHLLHKGFADGSEPSWATAGGLPERKRNSRAPREAITHQKAMEVYASDIGIFEDAVEGAIGVDLNQGQFDALVSLAFNIGGPAFRASTLARKLNAGDYSGASDQFKRWNKSRDHKTGELRPLQGLTNRRAAEQAMFDGEVVA